MRFRQGVYANRHRLSPTCQVLLLRLSDDMNANAIVSIPRSRLAQEFDTAPPRITEWIKQARELGFLSIVRRGRPGITAVYQGMYVSPEVRPRVPSARYAEPDQAEVRPRVPSTGPAWYAHTPTQEVVETAAIDADHTDHPEQRGQEEQPEAGPPRWGQPVGAVAEGRWGA